MKLIELIAELESKSSPKTSSNIAGFLLDSKALKMIESRLFECDEFKNVVRINYIDFPNYIVDDETGEPISANRQFLGGKTTVKQVDSYRAEEDKELKFNKIVDLYSITLNKRYNLNADISKPGVWIYPTVFDHSTFIAKNQITVIWEPEQLRDALALMNSTETAKERIKRMFEDALDNMEPNIPCSYVLSLRCSDRSLLNGEELIVKPDNPHVAPGGDFTTAHSGEGTI